MPRRGDALQDQQVQLGPGETKTVMFGDASEPLTRGWAELRSDDEFIATEFFQLFLGGLKPRVGVLPSLTAEEIKFLGFVNEQFKSGLAVHNPSRTEATEITLRLKDKAGQEPISEKKMTLSPLQSEAAFLNEALLFGPSLSSFEGVVEISANSPPVAVLSLIQEATGDVATVAVETANFLITDPTNTAIGRDALTSNTTGSRNTASGVNALFSNTEGSSNTANGFEALSSNTTSGRNTASGWQALRSNTTGDGNTATGANSLQDNIEGISNTATGASALPNNTEGDRNTATGSGALFENTTGSDNTASGGSALRSNTTGSHNTASGASALRENTTGSFNIAIGFGAGRDNETGDNNIHIGNNGLDESNTIRVGSAAHFRAFIAGVQLVPASSKRFKQDIHEMGGASSDLMSLRPGTFRYKKDYDAGDPRLQYGLIAEEVAEVYPELVVNDGTGQPRTVEYQKLNVMLLNELQKQSEQIRALTERLVRLEQEEKAEVSEVLY